MRISAEHYSLRPTTVQKNWLLTIQPQFLLAVQRSPYIKSISLTPCILKVGYPHHPVCWGKCSTGRRVEISLRWLLNSKLIHDYSLSLKSALKPNFASQYFPPHTPVTKEAEPWIVEDGGLLCSKQKCPTQAKE